MTSIPRRKFVIRVALEERAPEILKFHKKHLTKYLWPRELPFFKRCIATDSLYEVVEILQNEERLVGLCYVASGNEEDSDAPCDEFGGIYIQEDCRPLGLPKALGICAIANRYAWAPPPGRLIAHVHIDNKAPLALLEKRLGFHQTRVIKVPNKAAPKKMPRDQDGNVVGLEFEFRRAQLTEFAKWLEAFSGTVTKGENTSTLIIDMPMMQVLADAVQALRAEAAK